MTCRPRLNQLSYSRYFLFYNSKYYETLHTLMYRYILLYELIIIFDLYIYIYYENCIVINPPQWCFNFNYFRPITIIIIINKKYYVSYLAKRCFAYAHIPLTHVYIYIYTIKRFYQYSRTKVFPIIANDSIIYVNSLWFCFMKIFQLRQNNENNITYYYNFFEKHFIIKKQTK